MYIDEYICFYTCMFLHIYRCTYSYLHVCIYILHTYIHTSKPLMYLGSLVYRNVLPEQIGSALAIHTCKYEYVHLYICKNTQVYKHIYSSMYMY